MRRVVAAVVALVAGACIVAPHAHAAPPTTLHQGDTGSRVQRVQQELQWLGYRIHPSNLADARVGTSTIGAVNEFREKFGYGPADAIGPRTQKLLRAIAGRTGVLPVGCTEPARAICIDLAQRLLRFVDHGKVRLTTDARFGQPGEETRTGSFRVHERERHNWSSEFDSPMPYSLFFSGAQAIHYSPYFRRDGYTGASHGCVNLRDRHAARWLFDHAPLGTPVIVYSSAPDTSRA